MPVQITVYSTTRIVRTLCGGIRISRRGVAGIVAVSGIPVSGVASRTPSIEDFLAAQDPIDRLIGVLKISL